MSERGKSNIDPKLQEVLKDISGDLTDEQKEKANQCRTFEDLMKLAEKEGIEMPDEVMDKIAGGYPFFREFDDDKRRKRSNGNS